MVMERLRKLDAIAYIRFASVYRSYPNLQAMRQEMDRLLEDVAGEETRAAPPPKARAEKANPERRA
jgi:transcriptional repressor NrdR